MRTGKTHLKYVFLVLTFLPLVARTQEAAFVGVIPEVRLYYGFTHVEEANRGIFSDAYYPSFELSFSRETYGLSRWEILYNYPRKGVALFYSGLTGTDGVRSIYSATPFINFSVAKEKDWETSVRIGAGAAYFDIAPIPKFTEKGEVIHISKANAAFNISTQFSYSPVNRFTISAGLSGWHFNNLGISNSAFFLNMGSVFLGASYVFNKGTVTPQSQPISSPRKRWITTIVPSAGIKQRGDKNYFPLSLSVNQSKYFRKKKRYGITGDAFYDPWIKDKLARENKGIFSNSIGFRAGIAPSVTFVIGALHIPFDFGVYLFPQYVSDGSFYQRLGFRYYFQKNFFLNTTIKSHFFNPDHVEAGIGVSF